MYDHKRGAIKNSAVKAVLHTPLFSQKVEKPRKGKGSYRRQSGKGLPLNFGV